ncbi:uncharacterized protein LOC128721549 [Anopheles nili]|uniref:uncharacterized protein LOC128721549 n=1 Tax=Anopheles nili TaxID=185578 RepID=UPI00237BF5AB|nr:uncharacterized protein LOC128721549 [Anopheles nili]
MDKIQLKKQITTLRSLVKSTRTIFIQKHVRDHKFWSSKVTANSENQRAQKKAESAGAVLQYIRSLGTADLVEEVLKYQPPKNGQSLDSGSVPRRTISRFCANEKLGRHLSVVVSKFIEDNSKVLKSKVIMKKANNYKPPEEEEEDEGCELITDSFFITNTGKHYVAVAPKRKANANNEEDGEEEIEESWKLANRRKRRSQQWNSGEDENVEDLNSKMAKQPTGWEKSSWNEKKHSSQTEAMEDLHPSWAAKQAQKGIKPFAGKKVIFGNEDDYGDQSVDSVHSKNDLHPSWAAKQAQKGIKPFIGKKIVFNGANNSEQEATSADNTKSNLHPSWAAKQAQQGIKPFAGKKVVFDNEVGNEANSMGDLHPSWAAKQAQKGIKPFAGKKVVFNDEDDSLRDPTTDKRYIHPSWAAKQAQKGIKPFAGKKVIFNEENGSVRDSTTDEPSKCDIHPSWAAKLSQKGIKPFAGKKVVFDNEDSSERVAVNPAKSKSDLHPSWAAKQAQQGIKPFAGKKVVFDATDKTECVSTVARKEAIEYDSKNDVHPSWAAKQAQKGIKQFAGKKVIFDTDNNDNQHTSNYTKKPPVVTDDFVKKPHPAPSDLHPSWAAKQAQNGIKPFAGTKISFDD